MIKASFIKIYVLLCCRVKAVEIYLFLSRKTITLRIKGLLIEIKWQCRSEVEKNIRILYFADVLWCENFFSLLKQLVTELKYEALDKI